jgi:dihydropyrimidine dehydrogenase (NAD+) subunit PreA
MKKIGTPGLNTTFAGIEFRSPIGVGAIGKPWGKNVSPSEHAEILLRHVESGAGYICIPTCWYSTPETREKLRETAGRERRNIPVRPKQTRAIKIQTPVSPYGLEGLYLIIAPFWNDLAWSDQVSAHSEELTKILTERKPNDVRLIANVGGLGSLPETYVDGALKWEELGADLIEINVSCGLPLTMTGAVEDFMEKKFPPRFQGALLSDHGDIVEQITENVVKAVSIPVGVKISPETGFPRVVELAKRIKDAGARWIQVVNMAVGIAPPDIYNRGRPLWPFADGNPFVSASGSWLRIKCYTDVAAINKFVPGIDIAAAGGLVLPEHVVEVMMLGARLTQLCTGVIERGRKLIRLSDDFLKKFMVEQGYQTVEEIIGLGQQYIKYNEDVDLMAGKIVAKTDESKCNGCGVCVDNICIARYREKKIVKTREEKCAGCGGCILCCPTNAIKLVQISN